MCAHFSVHSPKSLLMWVQSLFRFKAEETYIEVCQVIQAFTGELEWVQVRQCTITYLIRIDMCLLFDTESLL